MGDRKKGVVFIVGCESLAAGGSVGLAVAYASNIGYQITGRVLLLHLACVCILWRWCEV